jgi:hypothetical protein
MPEGSPDTNSSERRGESMSRKVKRQKVSLDSGGVKDLSRQEIEMILRAADDLIMKGGRNMLVKTLKDPEIRSCLVTACRTILLMASTGI